MSAGNNRKCTAADPSSGSSKKSEAMAVALMVQDLERLNCPICFELPTAEVYQCSDGHSVCSKCIVKLKNCPTCAVPYEGGDGQGIRNRFAEEILATLRFNCTWKKQGCDQRGLTGQQVTEHEEQCSFNPNPIKLCALLFTRTCGYEVSREFLRNPSVDLPDGWEDHLQATHYTVPLIKTVAISGSSSTERYSHMAVEAWFENENGIFHDSPFRLVDISSGDPVGLFMIWLCTHDKQAPWFIVRITDPPKSCSVRVKFTLKGSTMSEDDGVFNCETSWDGLIIGLHEFKKFQKVATVKGERLKFSLPFSHLKKQYVNEEGGLDLQYVFTVTHHRQSGDSSSDNEH